MTKGEWRHLHATLSATHAYKSNTHKIRRKLKTKYIDNKNKMLHSRRIRIESVSIIDRGEIFEYRVIRKKLLNAWLTV